MNLGSQAVEWAGWVVPEILLVAFTLAVVIADLMKGSRRFAGGVALVGLVVTGLVTMRMFGQVEAEGAQAVFGGTYVVDSLGTLFKVAFLGAGILVGVISIPAIRGWRTSPSRRSSS